MISIKGGTQTWSSAKQETSFESDNTNFESAQEWEKTYGDKGLDEVLNKVADPNWTKPVPRAVGNPELGKDAFLKLLLAQLKNQDPTNTMKSHEMAAQLAQFSSLEKLQNIDDGIMKVAKQNEPQQSFEMLNFIGKAVKGDSTKVIRTSSTDEHDINFKLAADAENIEVVIKNALGEEVRKLDLRDLKQGANKVSWNGVNEDGAKMPTGEYRVTIMAKNSGGQNVGVETKFEGIISGVNFTANGPVLMIGNQKVRMADVKEIVDPTKVQSIKSAEVQNKVKATGEVAQNVTSQLQDNVGMSREMINKLNKETE